jgi:cytochrome bd-type quinol oxidase subunit 2
MLRETNVIPLQMDFRRRAIWSTVAVWALGLIPALLAKTAEPSFFAALSGSSARIAIGLAMVLGIVVMLLVQYKQDLLARIVVGAEIFAVLGGWFGAQAPALVPGHWTLASAASPPSTVVAFLIAVAAGAVFLIPSFLVLFSVFKGPGTGVRRGPAPRLDGE